MKTIELAFAPRDYVLIKLHGLNYKGRVYRCFVHDLDITYEVEFADDKGDLQIRTFRSDELEAV